METTQFIDIATEYVKRGWNPICIHKESKHPLGYSWERFKHRKVSQGDVIDMADYYEHTYGEENLNLGIITGKVSNLVVLDIDSDTGYAELQKHGISEIPNTLRVKTGRGMHYYFSYTDDPVLRTDSAYLKDVDLRTDGGLVVAPPSIHQSGRLYAWEDPDAEILPFPQDILALFRTLKASRHTEHEVGLTIDERADNARNATLFKAAVAMQKLGFSEDVIRDAIIHQNELLADPLDEHELENTMLSSVFKYACGTEVHGLTDHDNAVRMRTLFSDQLVYIPEVDTWYRWNGKVWEPDAAHATLHEKFTAMSYTIPAEVPEPDDTSDKGAIKAYEARLAYATSCRNHTRVRQALPYMQSLMYKKVSEFDTHDTLLTVRNGVLNLTTGKLSPHAQHLYQRSYSDIMYDPDAKSEVWENYLTDVFGEDVELRHYVQKAVGYAVTGFTNEKAFFIIKGASNTGKSVFLNTLGHIMGDYYHKANTETFLHKSNSSDLSPDLHAMHSKRLVVASETNQGDRFNEKLIKDITGGEPITARTLYKPSITYQPKFKLWLSTNTLPAVYDDSAGIWNRVKVIPFDNIVPSDKMDIHLMDKLRHDSSAILNWILEGVRMYLAEGLDEPTTITESLNEYMDEADLFGGFIKDCFIDNPDGKVSRNELYATFLTWSEQTGSYQRGMSNRKLFKKIRDKGYTEGRSNDNTRYFRGLELRIGNSNVVRREGNVFYPEY